MQKKWRTPMIKRLSDHIKHLILVVGLCSLLIGCDGGIFGTGDGSTSPPFVDTVSVTDSADSLEVDGAVDSATDQVTSPTETDAGADADAGDAGIDPNAVTGNDSDDVTGEGTDTPNSPEAENPETPVNASPTDSSENESTNMGSFTTDFVAIDDAVVSANGLLPFSNQVVIEEASTEISLVNDTDMNIGVFTSQDTDATSILTLTPGDVVTRSIQPTTSTLYFDEITESNERINQIVIDPLSIVNGSITLAVLTNTDVGVRLLAMPSYNVANTNDLIPLRFVFPFLAGDPAVPSTITLTPNPLAEQTAELPTVTFNPISSDLPITNYQNVSPGDYFLNDDAGRYSNVSIQVQSDDLITTIIFNSDGTPNRVSIAR